VSVLAIVLIVLFVLIVVFLVGGYIVAKRRANRPGWEEHIRAADHALEQARAADRGWDRALIDAAAHEALRSARPGFSPESLELVLVDDRPGVEEDRAHLVAAGPDDRVRLVLCRDASGAWGVERVE
jgi:Na+-transporting methylmalonyl-CoA/oxaloacetate decarboxylase gamma subunit